MHDPNDDQVVELGCKARLVHLRAGEEEDMHKLALYPYLAEFACNLEDFRKRNGIRYDLIHSHYWLSGWVGKWLQQWWGISHAIMFHTLGAVKNAVGVGEDEPELRTETEKDLATGCHRIIAATEKERDDLVRYCGASPDTIRVIPCGVNLELFRPMDQNESRGKSLESRVKGRETPERSVSRLQIEASPDPLDGAKVVLFVGRLDPLKGIENLLAAASNLSRTHHLQLIVVGGDDKNSEVA